MKAFHQSEELPASPLMQVCLLQLIYAPLRVEFSIMDENEEAAS